MDRMTKQDELVFLPLGGSGEIGMNFNAYGFGPENDRQWIIVDCGVLFGREGNTPGVDLIMPDIRYLVERRENILAIIATHAPNNFVLLEVNILSSKFWFSAFTTTLWEAELVLQKAKPIPVL